LIKVDDYTIFQLMNNKNMPMKKELIIALLQKFERAAYEYKGIECWSARDLQKVFDCAEWRNF